MNSKRILRSCYYGLAIVAISFNPLHAQEDEVRLQPVQTQLDLEKQFFKDSDHLQENQSVIEYENLHAEYTSSDYLKFDKAVDFIEQVKNKNTGVVDVNTTVTINGNQFAKEGQITLLKKEVLSQFKISDMLFDNVLLITIEDKFTLTEVNSSSFKYQYDNIYVQIFDNENDVHIATIKYINYTIRGLSSEYKSTYINPEFSNSLNQLTANSLKVIPNPANESAKINFELYADQGGITTLDVYDVTGKRVRNILVKEHLMHGKHSYEMNTDELSSGMYYLYLKTPSAAAKTKFIVKH